MQQNSDMITLSDFILPRDNIVVEMLNKRKINIRDIRNVKINMY